MVEQKITGKHGWKYYPLLYIVPFLTYDCTRNCPYCYTHAQHKRYGTMNNETFKTFIEWCAKLHSQQRVEYSTIVWLGGEPLLITDKIKQTMDRVNENNNSVYGMLFTNGDLLDTTNFNDLDHIQWMFLNISDTPLDECIRRSNIIKEKGNTLTQTFVITLDDTNMSRIEEITYAAFENNIRLRLYKNMYESNNEEYKKKLISKMHKVLDIFEDHKSKGYEMHTHFMFDAMTPSWKDVDKPAYFCGKGVVTIHPDGTIGNCIRNTDKKVGTIWDEMPLELIKDSHLHWSFKNSDIEGSECKTCPIRSVCQGGCPNDRLLTYGTYKGKPPWCEVYKEIMPRIIRLTREL